MGASDDRCGYIHPQAVRLWNAGYNDGVTGVDQDEAKTWLQYGAAYRAGYAVGIDDRAKEHGEVSNAAQAVS